MSATDAQRASSDRYLGLALEWLRLTLEHVGSRRAGAPALTPPDQAASASRLRRRRLMPETGRLQLPPGDMTAEIRRLGDEVRRAAGAEPRPLFVDLADRFELRPFEVKVLLLCTGIELDPYIGELCGRAHGDARLSHPTFALAFSVFADPDWAAISPRRPLRYWGLIEINQPPGQPLTTSPLRADERAVNYVKGSVDELDDRLEPLISEQPPVTLDALPPSQRAVADRLRPHLRAEDGAAAVVQLLGSDAPSKRLVAAAAATAEQRRLYSLAVDALPSDPAQLDSVARLWRRERALGGPALYLDALEAELTGAHGAGAALARFLGRAGGEALLDVREPWPGLDQPSVSMDVGRPTGEEQRDAWERALGPGSESAAGALSSQFDLHAGAIARIASGVRDAPRDELRDRAWDACLSATRTRLDALAQRVEPKATFDDIVLPDEELALLHRIAEQVGERDTVYGRWGFGRRMSRGFGINALFAGPSGTGKTMAAEVIAHHLRLNLYRIDLSAVVNKYIGETEKNLRRVFDAAEEGSALLFFDEADALFGKRSEVKDSHDRYANIEINYLLQRMEGYRGLAILATNMRSALDTAFMRRLRFVVNFPFPEIPQRRELWERAFPAETPTGALDFDRLARLPATGGMVHNIALNAAFTAARDDGEVTMPLVLDAAKTEFRKLEMPVPESSFAWEQPVGTAR